MDDAVATIDRVRSEVAADDAQLALTLDALRIAVAMTSISRSAQHRRVKAQLRNGLASAEPGAAGTRGAAILLATVEAAQGTASSHVCAAVDEAWGDGALLNAVGTEHGFCSYGAVALWTAGELEALDVIATQIADRAAIGGSAVGAYLAWLFRALARVGMGHLADAEAAARAALQSGSAAQVNLAADITQALLARILVERGDLAGARARLARIDAKSDIVANKVTCTMAAAILARAEGVVTAERQALRDLQRMADVLGFATWVFGPWPAALAIALGPCDEAWELADQALTAARMRGRPGEIGIALRAQALVNAGGPDVERLRTALAELERSELALEHARTLVELGAALRRRGHRSEARQPLAAGLERAFRCGAAALVERARVELKATGARPRRLMVTGQDALTPSERRIAILAAEGRSNREIAQALFVTSKTVETHLSHAYRKLDITSRTQIASALTRP